MTLSDYGFTPSQFTQDLVPGRVIDVRKNLYGVMTDAGEGYARISGKYRYDIIEAEASRRGKNAGTVRDTTVAGDFPVIGDFVYMTKAGDGEYIIEKTAERRTVFNRFNSFGHAEGYIKTALSQPVAANFDYVFILQSLNRDFNLHRVERYLTLAWESGAVPAVILTKADLSDDTLEKVRETEKVAAGVCVFAVSALTGQGLDELRNFLSPRKTIVFLGSSGVGKSSLVNALAGKELMKTGEIREDDSRGRHTTTSRRLLMLDSGVMIIDTPGMREMGLTEASGGLETTFADVEEFLGKCRFSDCHHKSEPGCAIKAALDSGELSAERWESYLRLKNETKFAEDKALYLRGKEQWCKNISVINKNAEKKKK